MRMIVAGVRDGRSCLLSETETGAADGGIRVRQLYDGRLDAIGPSPRGRAPLVDVALGPDVLRWVLVTFPPGEFLPVHHTHTIDFHTIVQGGMDLILDDGAHPLAAGDTAIVQGGDHGWQVGSEGCVTSLFALATRPECAPADAPSPTGATT